MNIKVGTELDEGDTQSPPVKSPAMKATLEIPVEVAVKQVTDRSDIKYEVVFAQFGIVEAKAGDKSMDGTGVTDALKGLSGIGAVSTHGFRKGSQFKLIPPGANSRPAPVALPAIWRFIADLVEEVFRELTPPLPEDAVGVGAKWEVTAPAQLQSIKMGPTPTYELVSLQGEQFKIKGGGSLPGAKQKKDAIMPGPTESKKNFSSELTWDAGKLLPSSGTMELHSELKTAAPVGGQARQGAMKRDLYLRIEAK